MMSSKAWIFDILPKILKENIVSFDIFYGDSGAGAVCIFGLFATTDLHLYAYNYVIADNNSISGRVHEILSLRGREFKCLSACSYDNLLITREGDVFVWNWATREAIKMGEKGVHGNSVCFDTIYLNTEGKLTLITTVPNIPRIQYVPPALIPLEEKVVYFRGGSAHKLAVTENGFVYSWGEVLKTQTCFYC
jgi:hypothetical protein